MEAADLEDLPPLNPFSYWKERVRDHGFPTDESSDRPPQQLSSEMKDSERRPSTRSPQHSPKTHPKNEQPAAFEGQLKTQPPCREVSKRRTPPPRPVGPSFREHQQGPVLQAKEGVAPQAKQGVAPQAAHRAGQGQLEELQEKIGRFEAANKNSSDAESYVPKMKKQPVQTPVGHTALSKSNSNPVIPERPAVPLRRRSALKSASSMEQTTHAKSKDFIPTIQTIRASTGDDLSGDDLNVDNTELFRPTKGKVLDAAKKMDSSFLIPQGQPIRGRRGSSGDINKTKVSFCFVSV